MTPIALARLYNSAVFDNRVEPLNRPAPYTVSVRSGGRRRRVSAGRRATLSFTDKTPCRLLLNCLNVLVTRQTAGCRRQWENKKDLNKWLQRSKVVTSGKMRTDDRRKWAVAKQHGWQTINEVTVITERKELCILMCENVLLLYSVCTITVHDLLGASFFLDTPPKM